jgi:hypothetical protein
MNEDKSARTYRYCKLLCEGHVNAYKQRLEPLQRRITEPRENIIAIAQHNIHRPAMIELSCFRLYSQIRSARARR